jgi:hypothetical protein
MKSEKYKPVASLLVIASQLSKPVASLLAMCKQWMIAWQLRKILFFIIFLIILVFPLISRAAGLVPCGGERENPCTLCDFFLMFQGIVNFFLFNIVLIVAVLMLVIGGFLFFFAGGSPSSLSRAKSVITSTVIGLIIIYTAWLIINTFFVIIGVSDWTGLAGGWFKIDCIIP